MVESRPRQQLHTNWNEVLPNRITYCLVLEMGIDLCFRQDYKFLGVTGSACLAEFCPQRSANVLHGTGIPSHEGKADGVEKQGGVPAVKAKGQEHHGASKGED